MQHRHVEIGHTDCVGHDELLTGNGMILVPDLLGRGTDWMAVLVGTAFPGAKIQQVGTGDQAHAPVAE